MNNVKSLNSILINSPTLWFVSCETPFHYYFADTQIRKSYTELNKIYFRTATIHDWLPLLEPEENKKVIISSLKKLSDDKLISVYAFYNYAQPYSS